MISNFYFSYKTENLQKYFIRHSSVKRNRLKKEIYFQLHVFCNFLFYVSSNILILIFFVYHNALLYSYNHLLSSSAIFCQIVHPVQVTSVRRHSFLQKVRHSSDIKGTCISIVIKNCKEETIKEMLFCNIVTNLCEVIIMSEIFTNVTDAT